MDAKRIKELSASIRKGLAQQDVTIDEMIYPVGIWNNMLESAIKAVSANKGEHHIVIDSLKVLISSEFYKSLLPEAQLYAERCVSDYLNQHINVTATVEEIVTIPKKEFDALVKKISDDVLSKVKESNANSAMTELISTLKKTGLGGLPASEEVVFDPDDVLEDPAVFFTYSVGFAIMDDTRNGLPIPTPYKRPLHFLHMYRQEKMGRDRKEYIHISACHIASKKEMEWLRRHSLFGIKFFEKLDDVKTVDVYMQDRLVEAHNEIVRLSEHELISRCRNENVPLKQDLTQLRRDLVFKVAEMRAAAAGRKQTSVLESSVKAAEQIKTVNAVS